MEQAHINELSRLENAAVLRLHKGANRHGYIGEVHALVLPSFEDYCSYQILLPVWKTTACVPGQAAKDPPDIRFALAVKTVWKRLIDVEKFRNSVARLKHGIGVELQPTIEEIDVNLSAQQVSSMLARAAAMKLSPYIPTSNYGCDGTSYEIALGRSFAQTRYKWWHDAPTGWKPLETLLMEIVTLIENAANS